jgi:L-asparagine transporter-like permease
MNTPSRVIITAARAAILASSLLSLSLGILENESSDGLFPIFLISTVITFIISFIMILVTIVPFHEWRPELSLEQKFKRYFPWYSITFFSICLFIMYLQSFEQIIVVIFSIAYLTGMQSWMWFFKQNKLKNGSNKNK